MDQGGRGAYSMIFDYEKEKRFEEALNKQHYPFLIAHFSNGYKIITVQEVTDLDQQLRGIDIELHTPDGTVLTGELKTDRHTQSPNIFLEDISNSESGSLGWTLKCESDILSYGFCDPTASVLVKLFVYDMQALKGWYQQQRGNYPLKKIPNRGYDTFGRPVPRSDIVGFLIFQRELVAKATPIVSAKYDKLAKWI